MALASAIEWTEATWNPLTGCTKISPGCGHCYAERMSARLQAMGQANYATGFELALHEEALGLPFQWKKPRTVFVNSMSDLFHENVPQEFIIRVFDAMRDADWHSYQVLTKRSGRLREMSASLLWTPNVWMGVSIENADYSYRLADLRATDARVRFLSLEPLLGPVESLSLEGIHWVIVGGESGPRSRPMDPGWARGVRDQCIAAGVPFFFKQWGGARKKAAGRELDGRTWDEMPSLAAPVLSVVHARSPKSAPLCPA